MRALQKVTILTLILAFAAGLSGCGGNSHSKTENDKDKKPVVPVEVAEVLNGNIAAYFTGTALVEAEEETDVVAKVGGVVEKIFVEEGDYVKAGQVLAKLDDEMISVRLAQAEATLKKLESNFRRNEDLHKKKLVSTEVYQQVKYEYEQQKAAYELEKLSLDYTSIRTPISGVVAERKVKVGNMIIQNAPVFRVTGLNPIIAVLHVPERQLGKIRPGLEAHLLIDALDHEEFSGSIKRISPVVDPATGTVKVTIETHDPSGRLRPGMFARIEIIYDVHANIIKAPKEAIISEDKLSHVFVVRDSVAYRQDIEIGYINTTHVEVLKGLEAGDTLVTIGKGSLKDSTRVDIVKPR